MKYIWHIAFLFSLCIPFFSECSSPTQHVSSYLLQIDSAFILRNDSLAFALFDEMPDDTVEAFGSRESALYAVLVNQAMEHQRTALDDSFVQSAVDYYSSNSDVDAYHEGLAYYYMGHLLRKRSDVTAIQWYQKANEKFVECNNYRYQFLCWNFISLIYKYNFSFQISNDGYRRCLQLERHVGDENYRKAIYSALCVNYSFMNQTDTMMLYADTVRMLTNNRGYYIPFIYESFCRVKIEEKDYEAAEKYCDTLFSYPLGSETNLAKLMYSEIQVGLGNAQEAIDSALSMPELNNDLALEIYRTKLLYFAYEDLGNKDSALYYSNVSSELTDSIIERMSRNKSVILEQNLKVTSHTDDSMSSFVIIIAILFSFLLFFLISFVFRKRRLLESTHVQSVVVQDQYRLPNETERQLESICMHVTTMVENIAGGRPCIDEVERIINNVYPGCLERLCSKFSFFDRIDAMCFVCWASGVSLSNIGRVMLQSKSFSQKRIERLKQKFAKHNLIFPSRNTVSEWFSDIF